MSERIALTAQEVAKLLGLDRRTVYMLGDKGELPFRWAGRKRIWHRDVVERWLRGEDVRSSEAAASREQATA